MSGSQGEVASSALITKTATRARVCTRRMLPGFERWKGATEKREYHLYFNKLEFGMKNATVWKMPNHTVASC